MCVRLRLPSVWKRRLNIGCTADFDPEELKALEDHKRNPFIGWFEACAPDSPANIKPWAENATDERQRELAHLVWAEKVADHPLSSQNLHPPTLCHLQLLRQSTTQTTAWRAQSRLPGTDAIATPPTNGPVQVCKQ
jgi:hypothetical protein